MARADTEGCVMMEMIGIHTPDKTKFPNFALMKISAWHKARGSTVDWYEPLLTDMYSKIYSSSVFSFADRDYYLPDSAIKGGTGYGIYEELPEDMDNIFPDYSIYPNVDYAIGYLTRGCIRHCPWCIVPKKEGKIHPYKTWQEIARKDTNKIVLMDNNVLASEYGLDQIIQLSKTDYRIDFNQGLDARLIDANIAELLASAKWIRFIRLACDTKDMMNHIEKSVNYLREAGFKKEIFVYVLVKEDINDAHDRVEFLRKLNCAPFAQPYRDYVNNIFPTIKQKRFARWVNHKAIFNSVKWEDYKNQKCTIQ
jgi:hypothetical protein